ncbi:MAG TPA: APC family permease [Acidimicrobiales bacterium]|nr:APC family permease [Acidimicrobiales bacterium]
MAASITTPAEDSSELQRFGYRQELKRSLSFFSDFGVAFCYLSPVVGIYSLFALGVGTGGPAYIWTIPIVVGGQLLVSLVFAELASSYPLAGALYQWSRHLLGRSYGWWVGWIYAWALIITVASVDTGITGFVITLVNNWFGTSFNASSPNVILLCTIVLIVIQAGVNIMGVNFTALIARWGVWVEVLGTFGVAVLLAIAGFHHGIGFLTSSAGVTHLAHNPFGVGFTGNWFTGAALIAILANVYIFYGFESAGDIAEEVVDARRRVPRAMVLTMIVGGITSFVLVGALALAIPGRSFASVVSGGVPYVISSNIHSSALADAVLALICLAFFSCGLSVQAAGSRVLFSYARDNQLPASVLLRRISTRFRTPVIALGLLTVLPALFALFARLTPSKPVHIWFVTYPAKVNALFILVSFATSGIYLSFQMVVLAAFVARLRGWRPQGFNLGRWAYPVYLVAMVYGIGMLINIIWPGSLTSPRAELFNYGWMTLAVMFVILVIGAVVYALGQPHLKSAPGPVEPPTDGGVGSELRQSALRQ